MCGRSRGIFPRAIRTGSWSLPKPVNDRSVAMTALGRLRLPTVAFVIVAACSAAVAACERRGAAECRASAKILRAQLPSEPCRALERVARASDRLLRADRRRIALPDPRVHRPDLPAPGRSRIVDRAP